MLKTNVWLQHGTDVGHECQLMIQKQQKQQPVFFRGSLAVNTSGGGWGVEAEEERSP